MRNLLPRKQNLLSSLLMTDGEPQPQILRKRMMVKRENNPNDLAKEFFKFKQFDVYHERGFKVSTEACIFGAYISKNFKSEKVLDIGTGTGLLSLMYAQNNASKITAIEINQEAA